MADIQPQHINYNLDRIQKAAKNGNNYVIATTDLPIDKWTIGETEKRAFWWNLNDSLYQPKDLADVIIQRLDNAKSISNELELYLRRVVAEKLKTVASIDRCLQLLLGKELQKQTIDDAVKSAGNGKSSLEKWFRTLQYRDQLLALGLSLFEGLFDDQFFAALERVVKNVWQQRDSSLQALDYYDLENLGNYFEFFEIKAYGSKLNGFKFVKPEDYATEIEISRINIRRASERQLLFEVAWESHRRQILTTLPELVRMVKDSVVQPPSSWELYGGLIRRQQLRNGISETLSDIGLVRISATSAVQDALLQLALDPAFEVQNVAASAMARWYRYDRDRELFGTLQNFYSIARQEKGNAEETKQWQDCIGATIALTVSYAAEYDRPDQLSEELYNWLQELYGWLQELSENRSSLLSVYFYYHTLPLVVPLHLVQLRDMLKKMAQQHTDLDQAKAIARSLARAYRVNSKEVIKTLNLWYEECLQNRPERVNKPRLTKRDRLLATVALTYGEIRCDEGIGDLTDDEIFRCLAKILKEERVRKYIIKAVIIAIRSQTRRHFEQIESKLQDLVANVTDSECNEIVQTLTEIYLEQRATINNGDDLTAVEKVMRRWIKDDTKPVGQQVAIKASVDFVRALKEQEQSQIKKLKQKESSLQQIYFLEPKTIGQIQQDLYLAKLIPWLTTLLEKKQSYQPVISNLLPEVFKQHNSRREMMSLLLGKWRNSEDPKISIISSLLKKGIGLAENFGWLALGGGTIIILTEMAVVNVIQNIIVNSHFDSNSSSVVLSPKPTNNSNITQQEAVNVIDRYLQAKEKIFGPTYDRQIVASVATGKYYKYITEPGGPIDQLQQKNEYYQYGTRQTEPLTYFYATGNQAEIDVKITEQAFLYENNTLKEDKSYSVSYRFTLEQENEVWKIADRVKITGQNGE